MVRVLGRISSCPGFHCLLCDCWLSPFWNSLSWFLGHHWLQDLLLLLWPLLLHLFCRAVFFYSSPKCHALSYRPWLRNRHVTPSVPIIAFTETFPLELSEEPNQNKTKANFCWIVEWIYVNWGLWGCQGPSSPRKSKRGKKKTEIQYCHLNLWIQLSLKLEKQPWPFWCPQPMNSLTWIFVVVFLVFWFCFFFVTYNYPYAHDSQIYICGQGLSPEQQTHRNNMQLTNPHTDVPQGHLKHNMLFAKYGSPNHTINLYLLMF